MTDKYGVGNDPYCYPGTSILINLLDIHSEAELEEAEVELTSFRLKNFEPDFDNLTFGYLCHIHRYLFQDLYAWAGEIRTVDISKDQTHFCNLRFILPEAEKCFNFLVKHKNLLDLSMDEFVQHLADFFCEMNVVHPFREGNGRALRLFCEVLALQAGYELSWKSITQEAWLAANVAGYLGDLNPLIALFQQATKPITVR
ncbi:putative adenosine monophosphate-protein transferase Fic [Rheinheimera soli]|jgi:cell filamentation protein|uniref:protein adenylyltransferase n=1 Tax=Rheinheimera soli TaxID=443616 RepID=A0ABU1VTP0_9GAMM|nr:putative adenosine monophosphate-protein transferase Fic [Rheinheimera soli]MDR7119087.1 cell filamentation protein [Rheinheimera soli]